jgi:hypothetical protein
MREIFNEDMNYVSYEDMRDLFRVFKVIFYEDMREISNEDMKDVSNEDMRNFLMRI